MGNTVFRTSSLLDILDCVTLMLCKCRRNVGGGGGEGETIYWPQQLCFMEIHFSSPVFSNDPN